jgi:hypothetical protein
VSSRAPEPQGDLGHQQLLKRQAPATLLEIVRVAREVGGAQSAGAVQEMFAQPQCRGQRLERVVEARGVLVHEREDLGR